MKKRPSTSRGRKGSAAKVHPTTTTASNGSLSPSLGRSENNETTPTSSSSSSSSLVFISTQILLLATIPLLFVAILYWKLVGLRHISYGIVEGSVRTLVQLSCLASLLGPIFRHGSKYPALVVLYCLFLLTLAAYEASARTKYDFEGQFVLVFLSLAVNVGGVALFTFGVVLRQGLSPCPWNPRYVIPIVGMLLGNSIGSMAGSMNALTQALVEQQAEIELYLSMGATPYEAVARLLHEAISNGAVPVLQRMRVIGLIAIPGTMTGQILGAAANNNNNSSTTQAARYQILIWYLIATATLGVILSNAWLVTSMVGFDDVMLRTDRFVPSKRKSVLATLVWGLGILWNNAAPMSSWWVENQPLNEKNVPTPPTESLLSTDESSSIATGQPKRFVVRSLQQTCSADDQEDAAEICRNDQSDPSENSNTLLRLRGLSKSFATLDSRLSVGPLFDKIDLDVTAGDLFLVAGPSGAGKSTFLKGIAGLVPMDAGTLEWTQDGTVRDWHTDSQAWRRDVRYVPQSKVDIPGTPSDFIETICNFQSWKDVDRTQFTERVHSYLTKLGLGSELLDMEWNQVSGGEAQRIVIAITLASKPRVILFDESTSALDKQSKMAVEESVKLFVREHLGAVLWISHDEEQAKRMSLN